MTPFAEIRVEINLWNEPIADLKPISAGVNRVRTTGERGRLWQMPPRLIAVIGKQAPVHSEQRLAANERVNAVGIRLPSPHRRAGRNSIARDCSIGRW